MPRLNLIRLTAVVALSALLGACTSAKTDPRLAQLTAGIAKDSVFKIMGVERAEKSEAYLVSGNYIEAMYFPLPGATDSASVTDRRMSPVIVSDGKLVAWGWAQWDSMATATKIVVAPK